jgi:hypothetical protein
MERRESGEETMKPTNWICSVLCTAVWLSAGPAWSQEGPPVSVPAPGLGEKVELLGFGGLPGGKVVKGMPFTAIAVSESKQTLADGNHITRKTETTVYRDGEGRVRKEVNLPAIGPFATTGSHAFVVISDPVAGTEYVLEPDHKIARKIASRHALVKGERVTSHEFRPNSEINAKIESLGRQSEGPGEAMVSREWKGKAGADAKTQSLGTQSVNGIIAEGTRTTHTIAAGEIGNDQPINIVAERWYSPDLQIVVMSKRSDPRFGDTTYTLTNIQRQEPGAAFFAVPADYTVEEGRPGIRMRGSDRVAPPAPPDTPPVGE